MTSRTGYADLPLHGGRVPAWLATHMAALGRITAEAIVHRYGREELLRRLAHRNKQDVSDRVGCVSA